MKDKEIELLDKVAYDTLIMLIQKSEINDKTLAQNDDQYKTMFGRVYDYAKIMIDSRQKAIYGDSTKIANTSFVTEYAPPVDTNIPAPVHDYGVEEVKEKQAEFVLHGRNVYSDTTLLLIENPYSKNATFDKHGIEVILDTVDSSLDLSARKRFNRDGVNEWEDFYIVKPVLFLHGKPVYEDTILETCGRGFDSVNNDNPSTEVIASEKDGHYGIPIELILEDGTWDKFYRVKE